MNKSFKLFGILGYPLSHTLSPLMQEAAFQAVGLKAFYIVAQIEPSQFPSLLRQFNKIQLDGFNVTVPYKEAVLEGVDQLTPVAKAVGAVNTVFRKGAKLVGTNTDVYGFVNAIKKDAKWKLRGKSAVILGAGGSARAILYGLIDENVARVTVFNRTAQKSAKLVDDFSKIANKKKTVLLAAGLADEDRLLKDLNESDIVVHCTSLGLNAADKPILNVNIYKKLNRKKRLFFDLIYRPAETPFLSFARKCGFQTMNGLGMLLYQGASAFEFWTGKKAPVKVMRETLIKGLAND